MDIFYDLVLWFYDNIVNIIDNVVLFMTSTFQESIDRWIPNEDVSDIINAFIDVMDWLNLYDMTPLSFMLGVGLPIYLVYSMIKWLIPIS